MTPVLQISPLSLPVGVGRDELWSVLCDLGDALGDGWVVVGGQMVLLHALQAQIAPGRVCHDLDVIIDGRVRTHLLPEVLHTLSRLGFSTAGVSADEVAHRFARGHAYVDLLVPEGLGPRIDARIVGSATTIEVEGSSQALARAERVPVRHGDRRARVSRPSLLGAIVATACAATVDPAPQRHLDDLARLCSIVLDPLATRRDMSSRDRRRLRAVSALADRRHEAWQHLDDPDGSHVVFEVLTG